MSYTCSTKSSLLSSSVINVLSLTSLTAIFSILGLTDSIFVILSSDRFFLLIISLVFFEFKNSSTLSIIPKKEVSAVFGMYEKTVFLISKFISFRIAGIINFPKFFLS